MGLFGSISCALVRGAEARAECREQAADRAAARQAERTARTTVRQAGRTDRTEIRQEGAADRRDELRERQLQQLAAGQAVGNQATFDALSVLHGQANYSAERFFGVGDGQTTGGALASWGVGAQPQEGPGYSVARPGAAGGLVAQAGGAFPLLPLLAVSGIAAVLLLR
jgi:hypothetical protein